ncbi:mannose-6-phosphate isomerase [Streptomyces sp. RKND-216]|uniref:SIS domain-containing protein n=1 Tax=Streptomyces sp. RKND-216 TaxID=2562581 RepID=UPI00109D8DE4|nr:SIS domain-containing protein [Streptomyces sp. RKND-216]THA26113.1 mannose-6-phosphate isomerase [Streptomyces sp. RKND-216]
MLDESLLDDPDALARADADGLLRDAAGSGARVRTAVRQAHEAGLADLRPDGRPRSVLVAGPGPVTACVAELLDALGNGTVTVNLVHPTGDLPAPGALRWALPGWAGPLDLLLLTSPSGDEPGLTALTDQAYRRGCSVVGVVPPRTPVAEAVTETHGLAVPLAPGPSAGSLDADAPTGTGGLARTAPGTLWALLTPLLALTDRLGLLPAPWAALEALADRLDEVAERCGPAVETYGNPAKTLAAELAGALPLLWSEGPVAGAAARHSATVLAAQAGRPALVAALPEAIEVHGRLLADAFTPGGSAEDDFFRDRVDSQEPLHTRVVLLREHAPGADSAVVAARDLAYTRGTPLSELEPGEGSDPLQAAAELIATLDFAAVYLTLALGDAS